MSNYMGFTSDKANIFLLLVDKSGSMEDDCQNLRNGLELYKKSFENFPEVNSIAVSLCQFDDSCYLGNFQQIAEMDTKYYTDGGTALYYSIVTAAKYLQDYIQQVTQEKGIVPRATFVVFSDGEPCNDRASREQGKNAIANLNYSGVTTVFIAFGNGISSGFGKAMGFMSTCDVKDRSVLANFLGVELSNSCKEQSRSMKALGADFFSQAAGSKDSQNFSQTTFQVLEDTSWIDDI